MILLQDKVLHHIWVQERSRFVMEYFRPRSQRAIKLIICLTQWEPQSFVMIWTLWQLHISMKLRWDWEHYEVKQKFLWEWQLPSVSFWLCAFSIYPYTLPSLMMSRWCQRRSMTVALAGSWSVRVPEPWFTLSRGTPFFSSIECNRIMEFH